MAGWVITTHCSACDLCFVLCLNKASKVTIKNLGSGVIDTLKVWKEKNWKSILKKMLQLWGGFGLVPKKRAKETWFKKTCSEKCVLGMCPRTPSKKVEYLCSRIQATCPRKLCNTCSISFKIRFQEACSILYTFSTRVSKRHLHTFDARVHDISGCAEGSPCKMCPTNGLQKRLQERACLTDVLIYFVWGTGSIEWSNWPPYHFVRP